MQYVYVLRSEKKDWRYVGITNNLKRRLREHNNGECKTTQALRPWKVDTYVAFSDEHKAELFEKYLKSGSGWSFLRKRF